MNKMIEKFSRLIDIDLEMMKLRDDMTALREEKKKLNDKNIPMWLIVAFWRLYRKYGTGEFSSKEITRMFGVSAYMIVHDLRKHRLVRAIQNPNDLRKWRYKLVIR